MTEYVRLTYRGQNDKVLTVWAIKLHKAPFAGIEVQWYQRVCRDGSREVKVRTREVIACSERDVVRETPARMNLKYAILEVE